MRLLEIKGAIVIRGEDGKRALEIFEKSQTDEYDVILMDVQMPKDVYKRQPLYEVKPEHFVACYLYEEVR